MQQRPVPSLAMVLAVRDEERFLAANLAYHRALGVARAYVFLDRCTDASRRIAQSFPWARTLEHDRGAGDTVLALYLAGCADRALELARAEGFEWLMFLDADEFAFGEHRPGRLRWLGGDAPWDRRSRPEAIGSLPRTLGRVQPTTEQVVLVPREVVPTPLGAGEPFWKLHYFQTRGALARPLLDPTTGGVRRLTRPLGHRLGKSIVRTAADVRACESHRWVRGRTGADPGPAEIPTEYRGSLYHFVVVSAAHWREKYGKHAEFPAEWRGGRPVEFPKQAWKEASRAMSEAEARAYYDRWVVVRPRQLLWPRLRGRVVRDTVVETVLVANSACPTLS